jgi:predicted negative regulator of RcsB-dependent stress response
MRAAGWRIPSMSDTQTPSPLSGTPLGEISQAPPALEVFLDKHQSKIIALALLIAVLAVVYVVYKGIAEGKQMAAGASLAKAEDVSELQGVVKNHKGTTAAHSATVLLAEKQWEDGQQDDAVATLKAFIDGGADHPALPNAKASLASKLLAQGKKDEATSIFQDLTEDPSARFLAPYAWISLGDIEAAKGDAEAARKAYGMIELDFPGSPFAGDAAKRLLLLKAKAPVEVAAPITVPETKLTEDGESTEVPAAGDLLDALQGGTVKNPLLDEPQEGGASE